MTIAPSCDHPALVTHGLADADWAACLMLDLRARGVAVTDDPAGEPGALVVVRSSFVGGRQTPPPEVVRAVKARRGPYVVARRHPTKIGMDDYPGRDAVFALWNDYFQPERRRTGKGGGGFAELLYVLAGERRSIDLAPGYVFVSYHMRSDGPFVHDRLRPVLARAAVTSWAYRVSERIPDGARSDVRQRLDDVVASAALLLVVGTPQWSTPWTQFEVAAARRHRVPVVVVRPAGVPASRRSVLADLTSLTLGPDARSAAALVRTLASVACAASTPTAASVRQRPAAPPERSRYGGP